MRGNKLFVLIFSLFLVMSFVSAVSGVSHSFDEISLPDCAQSVDVGVLVMQEGEWKCFSGAQIAGIVGGGDSYWTLYEEEVTGIGFPSYVRINSASFDARLTVKSDSQSIKGSNTNSGNYGIVGSSAAGVYGYSTGNGNSIYGYKTSGDGEAVYGKSVGKSYGYIGGSTNAVYGKNDNGNFGFMGGTSYAVYGKNNNGPQGYIGGAAYGVMGAAGSGGLGAGFFSGDVYIRDDGDLDVEGTLFVKNIETENAWSKFNGQVSIYSLLNLYEGALKLPTEGNSGECTESKRGYLAYRYSDDSLILCTDAGPAYDPYEWKVIG